jgi:hypothetical protein
MFETHSLIFLGVLIMSLIGVIIALYTRRGSGMDHHPYHHVYGGAPGANLPCEDYSGSDRTSVSERNVARAWRRRRLAQDPAAVDAQLTEARALRRGQGSQPPQVKRLPIRSPFGPSREPRG